MAWHKRDKALESYRKAADSEPDNIAPQVKLAEHYLAERKIDEASKALEKIQKINPKSHERGRSSRPRSTWRKTSSPTRSHSCRDALEDNPKSPVGHYYLGLAQFGNRDVQQAKASITEAIKLNPRWLEPKLVLADLAVCLRETAPSHRDTPGRPQRPKERTRPDGGWSECPTP